SWDAQKPNVILSDINMPKVSGIELLKMVFDDSKLCSIPFFVYSSSGNVIYEKKCSDLGAKGFFVKPFDLMEFDNIPAQILLALKKDLQIHPNDAPAF
ncbi:MAG TPA: response regulator, partial [Bacteroidia bacterium]|nr:response regulator [Bacteroidia bacterium]